MKTANKVIRYFAIALAVAIIVGICVGVISAVAGISGGFSIGSISFGGVNTDPQKVLSSADGTILYIEVGAANIIIKQGDGLSATTTNEYITIERSGDSIAIIEEGHVGSTDSSVVEISLPNDVSFDEVKILTGAGNVTCESLSCKDFELELGAGNAEFSYLEVTDEFDVETGAGMLTVKNGNINDADVSLGVGNCELRARFSGESSIEAGIGDLSLTLLGGKELYRVEAEVGIGKFVADGENLSSEKKIGDGDSKIEVEGGIGNVKIVFE